MKLLTWCRVISLAGLGSGLSLSKPVVLKREPLGSLREEFLIPGRKFAPGRNWGGKAVEKDLLFLLIFIPISSFNTLKSCTVRLVESGMSTGTQAQAAPSSSFEPLRSVHCLAETRSQGRCWAAKRLSHHLELSGHAIHREVDGLDIGRQHSQRFDLLRHTHKPQKGLYLFVQTTAQTSNTRAEAVKPDPCCQLRSQEFLFRVAQLSDVRPIVPSVYLGTIENWCKAPVKILASLFRRGPWPLRPHSVFATARSAVPFQEDGSGRKVRSLVVHSNLSAFHPLLFLSSEELMSCWAAGIKCVSRFEMPCTPTRWTGKRWVEQMSRLHGTAC